MQFLENDPRTFGSGYAKVMMWRYIRRYELDESHILRLERAALKYLYRPMRPEYKRMCQTMAFIGTSSFWQEVERHISNPKPVTQINAYCLYQYSKGLQAGERKRLELKPIKREIKRKAWEIKNPRYDRLFYGKHVLEAVSNAHMWENNQVIYRKPNKKDLPILLRNNYHELATFEYSGCKSEEIIKVLTPILMDAKPLTEIYPTNASGWDEQGYSGGA